jgi:16S rRNA (guanine527-N7)-methyltransferase
VDPVSRETVPAAALAIFAGALPAAQRYAELLASEGVARGLIGPRETGRLWSRHLLNCAVVAEALPPGADVCDVGSGAGLPGVVWALQRRDLAITLLEPSLRRSRFLIEIVEELGLGRVAVVRERAEQHAGCMQYSVVSARAVAPLPKLVRLALPLCRASGELWALKGSSAQAELAAAQPELRALAAQSWRVEQYGAQHLDTPTTVVRVVAGRTPGPRS